MSNQTKPGAMVLVPRELLERVTHLDASFSQHRIAQHDLVSYLAAPYEQPPAVGGEPEVIVYMCGPESKRTYLKKDNAFFGWVEDTAEPLVKLEDHRAHVAPLLAEIERMHASYETVHDVMVRQRARIAELEAGQGEAVAVMYANGTVLLKSDCVSESVFDICCKVQTPLYRQSQPAKAKVVLPDRDVLRDAIAKAIGGDTYDCTRVWGAWGVGTMSEDDFTSFVEQEERLYEVVDACIEEVVKLNGGAE